MPPKKKNKAKQLTALEGVDTSVLNLQQLQDFCVRLDGEIGQVEMESRELEIERNKLKKLSDVANEQLKEEKSRLRWTENELEREKEQLILKLMEVNNNVRNVQVELAKECSGKVEETFMNVQSITKSSVESCNELIQDIRDLNNALRNTEIEQFNKVIKFKIEHDENRSKLLQQDDDLRKVSMVHQKNRRREILKYIVDKCSQELEQLTKYKEKVMKQVMEKNDKDTLYTRRYYEKILENNRMVLEDLHDQYKTVKGNLTTYRQQITTLKADVTQAQVEIDANRDQRKTMHIKMTDSAQIKEELNVVRSGNRRRKENMLERKAEKMVLDEILKISENDAEKNRKQEEDEILTLQLRIIEQMTCLELLADRLNDQVAKMDQLMAFAEAKRPYTGLRMSCQQSTRVALQSLADEAEKELMEQRRISVMNRLNRE